MSAWPNFFMSKVSLPLNFSSFCGCGFASVQASISENSLQSDPSVHRPPNRVSQAHLRPDLRPPSSFHLTERGRKVNVPMANIYVKCSLSFPSNIPQCKKHHLFLALSKWCDIMHEVHISFLRGFVRSAYPTCLPRLPLTNGLRGQAAVCS